METVRHYIYKFTPQERATIETVLAMAKDPDVKLKRLHPLHEPGKAAIDLGSVSFAVAFPVTLRRKWLKTASGIAWYDSDTWDMQVQGGPDPEKESVMEDLEEILSMSKRFDAIRGRKTHHKEGGGQ